MRLKLKTGIRPARIAGLRPEIQFAAISAAFLFDALNYKTLTITSGVDGKHSRASKHYSGQAIDIRTAAAGITRKRAGEIAVMLRQDLGAEYDVVAETTHIHIEYDPKLPMNSGRFEKL